MRTGSHPVDNKQVSSTATQTDDNGCNNGCMSMYIDTIQSGISNQENVLLWDEQTFKTEPKEKQEKGQSIVTTHEMKLANNHDHSDDDKNLNTDPSHTCISNTSNGVFPQEQTSSFSNKENFLAFELQTAMSKHRHEEDKTQSSGMTTGSQHKHDNDDHNENTSTDADDQVQNRKRHTVHGTILKKVKETKSSTGFGLFANTTFGRGSCDGEDGGGNHCSDSISHGNAYGIRSSQDDTDRISDDDNTSRNMIRVVYRQDDEIEVLALDEKEYSPVVLPSDKGENPTQDVIDPPEEPDLTTNKTPEFHKCSTCGKVFKTKSSLHNHYTLQYVECIFCLKECSSKCNLTTHLVTHVGEKPYQCLYCKRPCCNRRTLDQHMRLHTGGNDKPFKCSVCDKKFTQIYHLKEHSHIHTGEEQFECNVCKKKFIHRRSYHRHIDANTCRKEPFECNICKKKFISRKSFHRHIDANICAKFKCPICNGFFRPKSLLDNHILVTHSKQKSTSSVVNCK